ncbi:MAG: 50S ribosomal protein L17 [Proteobacteria bacterium]|nr:50S ribosomal protein L17 [Pseudomonadota bacterium]
MRHLHSGRKLGRSPDHRRATLRALTLAIIENEAIQTIPSRAKELRWYAERAVTLAKRGDVASVRLLVKMLGSTETKTPGQNRVRSAIEKVCKELAPRFKDRPGGYTQIFRLSTRRAGDNAEQCIMRYIPGAEDAEKTTPKDKVEKKNTKDIKKKSAAPIEDQPVAKTAKKDKVAVKPAEDKKSKPAKKD